jgi:hypothetical protein
VSEQDPKPPTLTIEEHVDSKAIKI